MSLRQQILWWQIPAIDKPSASSQMSCYVGINWTSMVVQLVKNLPAM